MRIPSISLKGKTFVREKQTKLFTDHVFNKNTKCTPEGLMSSQKEYQIRRHTNRRDSTVQKTVFGHTINEI